MKRHRVLVTTALVGGSGLKSLSRFAEVYRSDDLSRSSILDILPKVDAAIFFSWPPFLTKENLSRMKRLRFVQSILVGVNHVPFGHLSDEVIVSSNAGAYSLEVGEHAWGLLLAGAKKIAEHHSRIREGERSMKAFTGAADDIILLRGRTLGIIGYGGIGKMVAKFGRAFGMKVIAWGRRHDRLATSFRGQRGLHRLLKESDAVLLSLPLTHATMGMIGKKELSVMKKTSVLVNVARGGLVEEEALYHHLVTNPSFRYASDVWWFKQGRETLETDFPIARLPNFVGTPHMSGPTGIASGRPVKLAVKNVIRYLKGLRPENVVDRSEYPSARGDDLQKWNP